MRVASPGPESRPRLAVNAKEVRLHILEQSRRAHVGHIGSALSVADIIAVLFSDALRGAGTDDDGRDLLVLSKGHAALALYSALRVVGILTQAELDSYCADGSLLGVHPEHELPGIDFSTGSLGHGLSLGAGAALAKRIRGLAGTTYVILSDAELNEGLVWEAAMFAGHHRLGSLVAILDDNRQQALAPTAEVLNIEPVEDKFTAFGWTSERIDGHDAGAIAAALERARRSERPTLIVADTVSGHGVSFMEREVRWHYLPMSEEEYAQAVAEVRAG